MRAARLFFANGQCQMDAGTSSPTAEFKVGARVKLSDAAGPRLANRHGTVVGAGMYHDAVRVILDGSKTSLTLHKKYLSIEAAS